MTPGVVALTESKQVCSSKWGKDDHRVTKALKLRVCRSYGILKGCPGKAYDVSYLIPRELGGADAVNNLWPQPIKEARDKHRLENELRNLVCTGKLKLAEAQRELIVDWRTAYEKQFGQAP